MRPRTRTHSAGRSDRIYEFLRANPRDHSIQAIADATDENGDRRITGVTLAGMATRGYAIRAGAGRYRVGETAPKSVRMAHKAGPRPTLQAHAGKSPGLSVPGLNDARSAQIAADIAAFQARGGRIERLGPTVLFHHGNASNDD